MRGLLLCLFLFVLLLESINAQTGTEIPGGSIAVNKSKTDEHFFDKIKFMPQVGLNFQEDFFSLNLSAQVGYKLSDELLVGIGGNYLFTEDENAPPGLGGHYYGGSSFLQYGLLNWLFVRGEFESMRVDYFDKAEDMAKREWQIANMFGAGISPKLLGLTLQFSVNYNISHDPGRSWRRTPWVLKFGASF